MLSHDALETCMFLQGALSMAPRLLSNTQTVFLPLNGLEAACKPYKVCRLTIHLCNQVSRCCPCYLACKINKAYRQHRHKFLETGGAFKVAVDRSLKNIDPKTTIAFKR